MAVRIGINPITWSNDDLPELGGDIPLERCLAEAHQAGYAGMELGNKFPRRAEALRPVLQRHGLALVSGWYSSNLLERSAEQEIAAVEDHLALLSALGCTVMVFCETSGGVAGQRAVPASRRPRLAPERFGDFGAKLTRVAQHLRARGVRMAYHHHIGTVIETAEEVDRLIASTGADVGLLLDTGHLTYAGDDPFAVAERHMARICHVHCKDVRRAVLQRARAEDWSFLDAVVEGVFTVPGDGFIDYERLCRMLQRAGYDGWLVVEAEQDPAQAHPLTYATMGYRNLAAAAAQAGLAVART